MTVASEETGCYFLNPELCAQASSKRPFDWASELDDPIQSTAPFDQEWNGFLPLLSSKEDPSLVKLRHDKYYQALTAIEKIFHKAMHDHRLQLYARILQFIRYSFAARRSLADSPSKFGSYLLANIPTAMVAAGPDVDGNLLMSQQLCQYLRQDASWRVLELQSRDCKNLKAFVCRLIDQLMGRPCHSHDFQLAADKILDLNQAHEAQYHLVFVIHYLEDLEPNLLNQFLCIVEEHVPVIPMALVVFNTTPVWNLATYLSSESMHKLTIESFQLGPDSHVLDDMVEHIFIRNQLGIHFGCQTMRYMLQQFYWIHSSLSLFMSQVKYCLMDYYFNFPLSVLAPFGDVPENILPILENFDFLHYERIRMNNSFQRMIESHVSKNSDYALRLLSKEHAFASYLPMVIRGFLFYYRCFSPAFRCLSLLQPHVAEASRKPTFELYCLCLESDLFSSEFYQSLVGAFQRMTREQIVGYASDCIEIMTEEDCELVSQSENIETLAAFVEDYGIELCGSVESADSVPRNYAKELCAFFKSYFELNLRCYTEIEGYEMFYYDVAASVQRAFSPHPKAALQNALLNPQQILDCICCDEQMTSSLPDISIVYKLYLEFGRWININDWFLAFLTVVGYEKADDDFEEIRPLMMARFMEAVCELQFLGFIKLSSKKRDYALRLTFDSPAAVTEE